MYDPPEGVQPMETVELVYCCSKLHALEGKSMNKENAHILKEVLGDTMELCKEEYAPQWPLIEMRTPSKAEDRAIVVPD